ncbi:hypothetical protein [Serratia sp. OPWLW2]|uniref:hypothetical protein n=1 Tax=Serratia sp. OPWLW2 TaxID=1928658 RepID=UPI000C1761D3|nr:hypothetical protein [Serratia sp. OPWLW2]PIJ41601.1 hypothetical protein BOM25_15960 [Serratia sp. OPWLW2]
MKELIKIGIGSYIDPAEVSAVIQGCGYIDIYIHGRETPVAVTSSPDIAESEVVEIITSRINAAMAERHNGV